MHPGYRHFQIHNTLSLPSSFVLMNESIVEEPESFVDVEPDQAFDGEAFEGPDGFADAAHPSSHLTRRVDVVRLHVQGELLLRLQVELDHGVGQRLGVGLQVGDETQHGAAERAVDLLQGCLARVVDVDDGHVAQEPDENLSFLKFIPIASSTPFLETESHQFATYEMYHIVRFDKTDLRAFIPNVIFKFLEPFSE